MRKTCLTDDEYNKFYVDNPHIDVRNKETIVITTDEKVYVVTVLFYDLPSEDEDD